MTESEALREIRILLDRAGGGLGMTPEKVVAKVRELHKDFGAACWRLLEIKNALGCGGDHLDAPGYARRMRERLAALELSDADRETLRRIQQNIKFAVVREEGHGEQIAMLDRLIGEDRP